MRLLLAGLRKWHQRKKKIKGDQDKKEKAPGNSALGSHLVECFFPKEIIRANKKVAVSVTGRNVPRMLYFSAGESA